MATTDDIGSTARRTLHGQEKPVGLVLRGHFLTEEVQWPVQIGGTATRLPRWNPRPHQATAIEAVINGFRDHDRGQLIMACGTGKTLTALWIAERLHGRGRLRTTSEPRTAEFSHAGVHQSWAFAMTKSLHDQTKQLSKTRNALFHQIAAGELYQLAHRIGSMTNGILDLSGDHEDIVTGLTRYLSVLRKGDRYLAVSIPRFWSPRNLGINGRFLTMNRLLAQRGVQIDRLFLVSKPDLKRNSEFARIAEAHLRVKNECGEPQNMKLFFREVDPEDLELSARDSRHKGAWVQDGSAMTIVPVYDRNMTIRTVRVRRYEGKAPELAARMLLDIQKGSTPLEEAFKRRV